MSRRAEIGRQLRFQKEQTLAQLREKKNDLKGTIGDAIGELFMSKGERRQINQQVATEEFQLDEQIDKVNRGEA